MKLSQIGSKLTAKTGILQLMDDLGKAMSGGIKMEMLGGGNPAHIPEIEAMWRKRMQEIMADGDRFERMVGNYTTPQGDAEFIQAMASFLTKKYGWNLTSKNIGILNGSQTTFFFLFNMLAGKHADGSSKHIFLPIVPEYIGYADQGMAENFFVAAKPDIDLIDEHTFKYRINFKNVTITNDTAAICLSRPTNPTGNVMTDEEIAELHARAVKHKIPLIIDNAYGAPFPHIIFTDIHPFWDEHTIYVMSMSKIGLPSSRTSIIIASEEVISLMSSINAIASLATVTLGQQLMLPYVKDGSIDDISHSIVKPFYQKKSEQAIAYFHDLMKGTNVSYRLHKSEGALFLWLWCEHLPISSQELYDRLKKKGVLVVSGHYFFPGLKEDWQHTSECLRITYSQSEETVKKGLAIIADELKILYR